MHTEGTRPSPGQGERHGIEASLTAFRRTNPADFGLLATESGRLSLWYFAMATLRNYSLHKTLWHTSHR